MAIVKGASLAITLVLTIVFLRKRLLIQFDTQAIWKSWFAAIIMFVVVGLLEKIYFSINLLLLYILVGGVVYSIALRTLKAVNEKDLELIRSLGGPRAASIINVVKKIFT